MQKLNLTQIKKDLNDLPGWDFTNESIHKDDLTVGWCKVGVTFTTHDAGGVTANDIIMAKEVEQILNE